MDEIPIEVLRVFVRLRGAEVWQSMTTKWWWWQWWCATSSCFQFGDFRSTEREALEELYFAITKTD